MSNYYCLLTELGAGLLASAVATGTQISLSAMAVGDGAGGISERMTALENERHRAPLNDLRVVQGSPVMVEAEMVIPATVGGWHVREAGLFTDTGVMFAVANLPASYKPAQEEGSTAELRVRLVLEMDNAQAGTVQLEIDPTVVLASRGYVDEKHQSVMDSLTAHRERTDNPHAVSWPQVLNKPGTYPPEAHEHPWSGITGKPTAFPPEEHNHDSHNDTRYLGKTAKAADSSKLEGKTKAQVVAEAKGVALKGTRTTDGTWTLTGLTIGVPVYLAYRPNHTSTSNTQYVKFSVISGSQNQLRPSGNQSTQFILAAEISDADNGTGGSAVIIPNSTTLKLNISSIGTGETVAAYQ